MTFKNILIANSSKITIILQRPTESGIQKLDYFKGLTYSAGTAATTRLVNATEVCIASKLACVISPKPNKQNSLT